MFDQHVLDDSKACFEDLGHLSLPTICWQLVRLQIAKDRIS
jgi:hypothetical protein